MRTPGGFWLTLALSISAFGFCTRLCAEEASPTYAFSFVAISDPRPGNFSGDSGVVALREDLNAIPANLPAGWPFPSFVFYVGDEDHPNQARQAYLYATTSVATLCHVFVVGNHEVDDNTSLPDLWELKNHYPEMVQFLPLDATITRNSVGTTSDTMFMIEYQNAAFVILDIYHDEAQATWAPTGILYDRVMQFAGDALAATPKGAKFVFYHEACFPDVRHVGDSLDADAVRRDEFWDLLTVRGVSTAYTAHTHWSDLADEVQGIREIDAGASGLMASASLGNEPHPTLIYTLVTTGGLCLHRRAQPVLGRNWLGGVSYTDLGATSRTKIVLLDTYKKYGSDCQYWVDYTAAVEANPDWSANNVGRWWENAFDPTASGWSAGTLAIGYDSGGKWPWMNTAIDYARGTGTPQVHAAFVRIPFRIPSQEWLDTFNGLFLGYDYDDAIRVWLNGVEILVSSNAPAATDFDQLATASHTAGGDGANEPVYTVSDISVFRSLLTIGTNILVVANWNANSNSTDLAAGVQLYLAPVNCPPVADNQSVSTGEDTAVALTLTASDADNDPLTYSIVSGPAGGSLSGTPPNVTYAPNPNFNGSDSFTFKANDGQTDSNIATVSITVVNVNDPPVANDQLVSTQQDTRLNITLTASDVDNDSLTYSVVTSPTNGSLSGTAPNLVYAPNSGYIGPDSFTFWAHDGQADSNLATVSITVTRTNHAPVANDQAVNTDEDVPVAITLTATDADNDPLTYSIVAGPTNGSLSGTPPSVTYTPNPNYNGLDSFTFKANDGMADSNIATVSISVLPVNDPPAVPQNLSATAGVGKVTLDWADNVEPEGDLQGYRVYRSTTPGYGSPLAFVTESAYVDNTVVNGTTYYYVVKALDASGLESGPSNEVSATPSETAYDAYASENPVVTYGTLGGNGVVGTHKASDGLVQTITEVANGLSGRSSLQAEYRLHTLANPVDIRGLTLYLNSIWTALDANDPLVVSIWNGTAWENITADIADGSFTPASNPQNYVDAGGTIRVLFRDSAAIRVEKKDTLTIDLLYAHVVAGPPDTTPPAAPTGLAATAGDLQVILDWNDNVESDLAGYNVYRSMTQGGPYTKINGSPVASSNHMDTAVQGGTTYYYVVTAVDQAQNESGQSNEVNATPTASQQSIHIQNIAMSVAKSGAKWKATARVLIHDQGQSPRAGATVVGDWSFNGVIVQAGASVLTDANGNAVLVSPPRSAKSGDVFTFAVANVSLSGYLYTPAQNVETQDSVAVP